MTLPERLLALHHALDTEGLPHAFGGAIALAYWTLDPRGTSDVDVNIFVPAADCHAALDALPSGVEIPGGTPKRVTAEGQVRLWWEQTPLDLFFDYEPIHSAAAANRRTVPFGGEEIPVLGPIELAVFKIMFDRTRDWADVEAMLSAGTLDTEAVRHELAALVGEDDPRIGRLDETVVRVTPDPDL